MNIKEACNLLDVNLGMSKDEIKKKYKKLMIKFHPDNMGGDTSTAQSIGEAYAVVLDTKDNTIVIKNRHNREFVRYDDLMDKPQDILNYYVLNPPMIEFDVKIRRGNMVTNLNTYAEYNNKWKYEVEIRLDGELDTNIEIEVMGIKRKIKLDTSRVDIIFKNKKISLETRLIKDYSKD